MRIKHLPTLILLLTFSVFVQAENGYDLWLRYNRIDNHEILKTYTQTVGQVTVLGSSNTIDVIRIEIDNALSGLLGTTISVANAVSENTGLMS